MNEFLKNKLNDYDAGFDQSAWESIQERVSENNNGNESLKENLKGFDAGYNQNAWSNIAGKVAQNNLTYKANLLSRKFAGAAVVFGILLTGLISFSIFNNDSKNQIAELKNDDNIKLEEAKLIPEVKIVKDEKPNKELKNNIKPVDKTSSNNLAPKVKVKPKPSKQANASISTIEKNSQLPKLVIEKNELCLGEELNARIINNSTVDYKVKVDGKWLKTSSLSAYRFTQSGKHVIELYEKTSKKKLIPIEKTSVLVYKGVNPNFNYEKRNSNKNQETNFKALDNEMSKTTWYVGNEIVGSESSINYTFINKGKYSVKMVACNAHGCKDSSTQTVRVLKAYNLLATQVFNPKKGTWLPLGLKKTDQTFELQIISSDGEEAFYSNNDNKEWDGIMEGSGKKAKDGDEFYWVAKVKNDNGNTHEYGGSFIVSSNLP